jgi:hypothetical protein
MVLVLAGLTWGQGNGPDTRGTLVGVKQIFVEVVKLSDDIEKDGLNTSDVQTDCELELRKAGVNLVPSVQAASGPWPATLRVALTSLQIEKKGLYAYSIDVRLIQIVSLLRDPTVLSASPTWSSSMVGFAGKDNPRSIRPFVTDCIREFANAWLAANPK